MARDGDVDHQKVCQHFWRYQQQAPGVSTRSLAQPRDNGNTNIRTCELCKLEQKKVWR